MNIKTISLHRVRYLTLPALWTGFLATTLTLHAQFSITPLSSFGGGGWLAPGANPFLTTGSTERGLAYGNGHLYLVSRAFGFISIHVLNPLTGEELGVLDTSGINGGTFAVNQVCVADDGAIYVNNLTVNSTIAPLTVYKWASETFPPTVAYTGDGGLAASRIGDSMAVVGTGNSTRLALGYSSSPSVPGNNGYTIIDPTAGTAAAVAFSGTPPSAGDFRLGITFSDASHVFGAQGSPYRYTSFSGSTGNLIASRSLPINDRLLAYAIVGGVPLLAVQNTGDSHVSIYDVSNPASPVLLGNANNTSVPSANTSATGELAWGDIVGNTAHLWAMSCNQGIQAFTVVVPPLAIMTQPQSLAVNVGSNATFCVTASGIPPLSYQWQLNSTNIFGATNNCYTLTNAQVAGTGNYTVVVTNSSGSITSAVAMLAVTPWRIGWSTMDGGGGTSTGAVFAVRGTIGQHDAGKLSAGNTILNGGFWGVVAVQTPGAPLLSIARTTTNTVAVFWPFPSTGWTLQENTNDVSSVNWSNVTTTPSDDGTTRTVIVNPPTGNRFYRLFKP